MTAYLNTSGYLAGLPELRTSANGNDYTRARVLQTFRAKNTAGEWHDTATLGWDVIVTGRQARQLVEAATVNGNLGIQFAGRLQVRTYQREDGTPGIAYDVMADTWAITPGQNAMIAKPPRQDTP